MVIKEPIQIQNSNKGVIKKLKGNKIIRNKQGSLSFEFKNFYMKNFAIKRKKYLLADKKINIAQPA